MKTQRFSKAKVNYRKHERKRMARDERHNGKKIIQSNQEEKK